jgi:hypothetical protein
MRTSEHACVDAYVHACMHPFKPARHKAPALSDRAQLGRTRASAPWSTRARRRTAQKLRLRGTSARGGVVDVDTLLRATAQPVAAARIVSCVLYKASGADSLPRGGGRGLTRSYICDPRGARRAVVAAVETEDVIVCKRRRRSRSGRQGRDSSGNGGRRRGRPARANSSVLCCRSRLHSNLPVPAQMGTGTGADADQ